MKNKNLILFIIIGFIVTSALWGFVGGCGTLNMSWKSKSEAPKNEDKSAEGIMLEESSLAFEREEYIVEQGDTLWKISKEFGVSVNSIKDVNKIDKDTISVGQKLLIPGTVKPQKLEQTQKTQMTQETQPIQETQQTQKTVKPGLTVHKVGKDESLWRIAQIYGTTIEHIAELNGLKKDAKLKSGQEILVPNNE